MLERISKDAATGHTVLLPSPTCQKEIGESVCGHCVMMVSGRDIFVGDKPEHFLGGKPWSRLKEESVLLPAIESYAPLATYILNSCRKMHCEKDVTQYKAKIEALKEIPKP